jgi:hypothetical protein
MANTKKYLDLTTLGYYDGKLKAWVNAAVNAADEATLAAAKKYTDEAPFDPAGTAQTKVDALANSAVKANTEAIATLNGDATTEGSVAKAIADSAATLNAAIEAVDAKADANAAAAKKAQEEVDAVETDMGDVDGLSTTNKTVVGAINEVLAAVGTGGTAAVVTITTDTTTDGALKSYTIKQGTNTVGTIDIPKDMVVESGSVVTNPEGQPEGTYIKLVLANVAEPLYVNVGTLVDIYVAKAEATQVQIAIDSATREISASIVAGSIGTTELADSSVTTAKIADANVTKAKLSTEVQASLDKADTAATKAEFDEEVTRAKAAEAQALVDAKAYTDQEVGKEKTRAEGVEANFKTRIEAMETQLGEGEGSVSDQIADAKQAAIDAAAADATAKANAAESAAKKHATDLDTAMDGRVDALEAATHTHDNKGVLDGIDAAKITAWDSAEKNAEDHADSLNTAMDARVKVVEGKAHEHSNKGVLDGISAEKVTAWDAAEGNAKTHANDLNSAMDTRVKAVETKSATNETNIGLHANRLTALEEKVGAGFVAITNAEIDALFTA